MQTLFRTTARRLTGAVLNSSTTATTSTASAITTTSGAATAATTATVRTLTTTTPSLRSSTSSPWSFSQLRFARFSGSDVRSGNVIKKKGKVYEVVKASHTTQGRQGAIIQVELRDIDSGNKVNERFRTDEVIEKVTVTDKSYSYLYTDNESGCVVLIEPETYDQIDIPKHMFGEGLPYLTDDMEIAVKLYDGKPASAKVPQRVTCTVAEAEVIAKGATAQPQYKKVLLDNGLTVQVPAYILAGEKVVINTTEHYFMNRA